MKKKNGFYLLPIVKLLDSYKIYSIIQVDPCGEVSWSWVLRCFSCFFSAETIDKHSAVIWERTPHPHPHTHALLLLSLIHSFTSLCCLSIHSLLSLFTTLSLSPSIVGLLLHLSDFYTPLPPCVLISFFSPIFVLSVFCLFVAPFTPTQRCKRFL